MTVLFAILLSLIGFSPDANDTKNLHSPLSGDGSRQSWENFRCASDFLDSLMNTIVPVKSVPNNSKAIPSRRHGEGKTGKFSPEYVSWSCMKTRCLNPNCNRWKNYGGRGIKICDRWIHSFKNFLADMGRRPTPNHSLDRFPNKDGDYEPGNCRWATNRQQMRNHSLNHVVEFRGRSQTIGDWADELGFKKTTLGQRIVAYGWSVERAFLTPVRPTSRIY